MARRFSGGLTVYVQDEGGSYKGLVHVPKVGNWPFDELVVRSRFESNSPEAYDEAAETALSFASYYTTYNRGSDVPAWAPKPELADAISGAMEYAPDYAREYEAIPGVYIGETAVVCRSQEALGRYYEAVEAFLAKKRTPRLTLIQGGLNEAA